jgi:restriction endonuclease S subunit
MYLKSDIGQALLRQLVAGTAMPQIATREIKEFKIPLLSEDEINRITKSFADEVKLYEEIEEKKMKINEIHNNFLGEK